MPYTQASGVLDILNRGPAQKRSEPASELNTRDFHFTPLTGEACPDGLYPHGSHQWKPSSEPMTRGLHRRQTTALTPGQTTTGKLFFLLLSHTIPPLPVPPFQSLIRIPQIPVNLTNHYYRKIQTISAQTATTPLTPASANIPNPKTSKQTAPYQSLAAHPPRSISSSPTS